MTDAEQVAKTHAMLTDWNEKEGHERCWFYPELFIALCELYGIKPNNNPVLPPFEEFEEGCKRFQADQYRIRK